MDYCTSNQPLHHTLAMAALARWECTHSFCSPGETYHCASPPLRACRKCLHVPEVEIDMLHTTIQKHVIQGKLVSTMESWDHSSTRYLVLHLRGAGLQAVSRTCCAKSAARAARNVPPSQLACCQTHSRWMLFSPKCSKHAFKSPAMISSSVMPHDQPSSLE